MPRQDVQQRPRGSDEPSAHWPVFWRLVFALLLCISLTLLALYLFSSQWTRTGQQLPVGLRSSRRANYSVDPVRFSVPPLQERILAEAVLDRSQPGETPAAALATLAEHLRTPVIALTSPASPTSSQPPTSQSPSATPLPVSTDSLDPIEATPTIFPSPTLLLTAAATRTPPKVFTLVPSAASTITREPPAQTPTLFLPSPTSGTIRTAVPTHPVPPTATPVPTKPPTLTPEPTQPGYPPPVDPPGNPTLYP